MLGNLKEKGLKRGDVMLPAVLCTALWGSAIPGVKAGYALLGIAGDDVAAKLLFAGLRFFPAGLLVLALVALRREESVLPKRGKWTGILALSAAQTVMQYFFLYIGLSATSAVRGSVLSATSTFFAVIAAHFLFADDRMSVKKAIGCIVGFAGVVVMMAGAGAAGGGVNLLGEGFVLISAVGQGLGAGISRKIMPGQSALVITGWQLALGGGLLLVGALLGGGAAHVTITPAGIALLAYLAAVSAVAFSIWTSLLGRCAVGKVSIYLFLIPVFGSLLGAIILQETVLTLRNLCALVLVCGGIAIVNRKKVNIA